MEVSEKKVVIDRLPCFRTLVLAREGESFGDLGQFLSPLECAKRWTRFDLRLEITKMGDELKSLDKEDKHCKP